MTNQRSRLKWFATFLFLMAFSTIMTEWYFVRFLHYHGQNRMLRPDDYEVQILTGDEYDRLSHANIAASNWSSLAKPNYKSVNDGKEFVLVTAKGTADFSLRWEEDVFYPMFLFLIAVIVWHLAQKPKKLANDPILHGVKVE